MGAYWVSNSLVANNTVTNGQLILGGRYFIAPYVRGDNNTASGNIVSENARTSLILLAQQNSEIYENQVYHSCLALPDGDVGIGYSLNIDIHDNFFGTNYNSDNT